MPNIETNITILENTADELIMKFEITNLTNSDLYVLKRNTPLEGLKSDCLIVTIDGERVSYDGYFMKRAAPMPEEYIELKAGATVSNVIDVSIAYDTSRAGTYDIKFDESKLVIIPATRSANFMPEFKIENAITSIDISNQQSSITRTFTETGKGTIGQQLREKNKKKVEVVTLVKAKLKEPKIIGGTPEQVKIVQKAHKSGYRYAKKAAKEVDNDNLYKLWFGSHTEIREDKVKTVYEKVVSRMERTVFPYRFDGDECDSSTFAYTTIGGRVIWLCNMFWAVPDEGPDSKAGTMVHEHSHSSGGTDDLEYSRDLCERLARSNPGKAIKNADNYEFYSEAFQTD
jgi:hypothetical protein